MSNVFTNAWIGYDLSYDDVEAQPDVKRVREQGVAKRVKSSEHHVTVGYFKEVDLEALAAFLVAQEPAGNDLSRDTFLFDGSGTVRSEKGTYVYFVPSVAETQPSAVIRQGLANGLLQDQELSGLHLSVGGADPFIGKKERETPLENPFTLDGKLVFVGKQGELFRKFRWSPASKTFVETALPPTFDQAPKPATARETRPSPASEPAATPVPTPSREPLPVHTIAIFSKIQADTAVAVYLLKTFGAKAFPGIENATVVFWTAPPQDQPIAELEKAGTLLVDLGGMFDHHLANQASGKREDCVSTLIAKHLELASHPALRKLLAWAKRDDLEGKGTISDDPLDRAFGLSGIIMNLNRALNETPQKILDLVLPLIHYHVLEEVKRAEELPREWEQMQQNGKGEIFKMKQGPGDLKCAVLETDNIALAGFLRAAKRMDLIVQRRSTGHTNVLTRQERSLDLRQVIAALRIAEAAKKGVEISTEPAKLQAPGKLEGIEEWYYDDAANTLQNGGVNPGDIPATRLSKEEILAIVKSEIPKGVIGSLKRLKEKELGKR